MALTDFLGYDFGNIIFKASWDDTIQKRANDNLFWKDWLNKKYNLELSANNLEYRKIAEKSDYLLAKMKEFNVTMTLRSFKYILLHQDIPKVDVFFKKCKKDTFVVYGDIRILEKEYNIAFEGEESEENFVDSKVPVFSFLSILTPTGKRNYKRYVDRVLVNTTYILHSGILKTVDYDADADKYVRMHLYAQLGRDNRWSALKDIGEAVYMRYFY